MQPRIFTPILFLLFGCSHHSSSAPNTRLIDTRVDLALAYMETGNLDRADFHLQRAAHISPDNLRYRLARIHYYELTQQNKKALASYLSLLKKHKTNPNVFNNFAMYQCRHAGLKQATELFESGLRYATGGLTGVIYKNAAICALKHKETITAQRLLNKAQSYQPDNPEIARLIEKVRHRQLSLPAIHSGPESTFHPTFNDK